MVYANLMNKLVIVESPNKIESIKKYLGAGYEVMASKGHIAEIPDLGKYKFGFEIGEWVPKYAITDDHKTIVSELKIAAKKADEVLVATDPDREGEAIAQNLVEFLGIENKYKRIRFNEITKDALNEAINHPTMVDQDLYKAQITRAMLDKFVGYKLSQWLKSKIKNSTTKISGGRVQSVALLLIVEREREIRAFVPVEYFTVGAKIQEDVIAELNNGNYEGNKTWVDPKEIENIRKQLKGALKVTDVSTSKRSGAKLTPLKLSALFKKADSTLGLSSASTQRAAQSLYEGYGDGGLISYPRTDSTRLSDVFVKKAQSYIVDKFGDNYVAADVKGSAGAQDAHEALRPTDITLTPAMAKSKFKLGTAEAKVYELIYNHTLQCLMKVPEREVLAYELSEGDLSYRLSASKVVFDGYLKVTGYEKAKELPVYKVGEVITVADYLVEQKATTPPARYNDGSLIETMEELGIGRPSTYKSVIDKMRSQFVEADKAMKPLPVSEIIVEKIEEGFKHFINVKFTAQMESELDIIAEDKLDYKRFLDETWEEFNSTVTSATQEISLTQMAHIPAGKPCPKCGSDLIIRRNKKTGQTFFACPTFPKCDHMEPDPNAKKVFKKKFFKKADKAE